MKKRIILLMSVVFAGMILLSSCNASPENIKVLDYQNGDFELCGVWNDNGKEYGITLISEKSETEERNTELSFTSPETLEGVKFIYKDTFLSASVGDMAIELEEREPDTVFRICELLSLSKDDITDIGTDKNGNTVAKGKSKDSGETWQVTTDKDGLPKEIRSTKDQKTSVLTVEKYKITAP